MPITESWFPNPLEFFHFTKPICPQAERRWFKALACAIGNPAQLLDLGTVQVGAFGSEDVIPGHVVFKQKGFGAFTGLVVSGEAVGLIVTPTSVTNPADGLFIARGFQFYPEEWRPELAHNTVDKTVTDSSNNAKLHALINASCFGPLMGADTNRAEGVSGDGGVSPFAVLLATLGGMVGLVKPEDQQKFVANNIEYNRLFGFPNSLRSGPTILTTQFPF